MPLNFSGATPLDPDPQKKPKYDFSGAEPINTPEKATAVTRANTESIRAANAEADKAYQQTVAPNLERIKTDAPAFAQVEKVRSARSRGLNFTGAVDLESGQPVVSPTQARVKTVTRPNPSTLTPSIAAQLSPPKGKSVNKSVLAPETMDTTREMLGLLPNASRALGEATEATADVRARREGPLVESRLQELKRKQDLTKLQYSGPERANIAHTLKSDEELRQQAETEAAAQMDLERHRPEIDAIKQRLTGFAGNTTAGGRAAQSIANFFAGTNIQGANLANLIAGPNRRTGEPVFDTSQMRLVQQALGELEHEDPDKGWLAAAERVLPGTALEAAKMVQLSGIPGAGRATLPGLGALSNVDKGPLATGVGAVEGELFHRALGTTGGLSRAGQFVAGAGLPAATALMQGEDPKRALLSSAAFGTLALAGQGKPKLVETGETRAPQQGEYFRLQNGEVKQASRDYSSGEFPILKEVTHHSELQPRDEEGKFNGPPIQGQENPKTIPQTNRADTAPQSELNAVSTGASPADTRLADTAERPPAALNQQPPSASPEAAALEPQAVSPASPELRVPADVAITSDYTERQAERRAGDRRTAEVPRPSPNQRTMIVNGDRVTAELTPENAAKFDKIDADLKHQNESSLLFQDPNVRKGRAMQAAAAKRLLHPDFETGKETQARQKREATNYRGKEVSVNRRDGTITGTSFGKVQVSFADGTRGSFDAADVIGKPPKPDSRVVTRPELVPERRITQRRQGALESPPEPPRTIDPATVQANLDTALADVERANTARDSTALADSLQRAEDAGATPEQIAATLHQSQPKAQMTETETSVPVSANEPIERDREPELATTSIKNAAVEADREAKDLPSLTPATRKSWVEAGDRARAQGLDQPDKADAIAESVLNGKKKQLTDEESAGLRDRLRSIENQYEDLSRRIWDSKDPAEIEDLRSQAATLKTKFERLTDATKKAGTEIARALAIRRSAVNRDFSLAGMERDFKVETGTDPSPAIRKQIEDLWKENDTLKRQLAEHEAKLADADAERAFKRLKNDAVNEQKRAARRAEKADLDKEAAELKDLIAKEAKRLGMALIGKGGGDSTLQPSGLGSLDELSTLVTRLARNRLKANLGLKASELAQEVHGLLKDVIDIDERQVREMIVGYGRKGKRQSELQRTLNGLKSELRLGLEAEDVKQGKITQARQGPPRPGKQGPKLSDVNRAGAPPKQGPPRLPKEGPPNTWPRRRAQLEKQIAEYERKIAEEDFGEKEKRPSIVYDREGNQLRSKLEATRRQFEALKEANKPSTLIDLATRWKRFSVLGFPTTLLKLGSAAAGRMAMTPIYNLVDVGARKVPGLRSAFTDTPKPTLKGEYKAVSQLWQSDSFKDILSHLKGGDDLVSLLYGEKGGDEFVKGAQGKSLIPKSAGEVVDRPGHYHAALKTIPKRAAFFREFENRLQEAEKNGRDVTDPAVQMAIAAESYPESQRAILQQRNPLTNAFNQLAGNLSQSKYMAARALGKGMRFEFPITKVPVNFVGETLQHIGGLPASLGEIATRGVSAKLKPILASDTKPEVLKKLAQRLPAAMEDLDPEQRQRIARGIKVGGVGLGFVLWGMMRPDQFGGYYQPGKRDPKDVKFGGMRFMGVDIPRYLGHIPPLEAAQFGATLRRVWDSMQKKGKEGQESATESLAAGAKGMAEEVPFINPLLNSAHGIGALLGTPGERQKYLGGEARSMIPGAIQQVAKSTDYPEGSSLRDILNPFSGKEPIARKPTSVGEEFKMGIPGLRQTVPISPVFGAKQSKGSEESRRLGIPVPGVKIHPDESVEQFEERQKTVNPIIRDALDALIEDEEYKSLSDEDKQKAIRATVSDVEQSYREMLPRKEPRHRPISRRAYQFAQ